jgi:hypothetical protein
MRKGEVDSWKQDEYINGFEHGIPGIVKARKRQRRTDVEVLLCRGTSASVPLCL